MPCSNGYAAAGTTIFCNPKLSIFKHLRADAIPYNGADHAYLNDTVAGHAATTVNFDTFVFSALHECHALR